MGLMDKITGRAKKAAQSGLSRLTGIRFSHEAAAAGRVDFEDVARLHLRLADVIEHHQRREH